MPKQKVYISSTFRDLKEYRATLIGLFQNQLKNNFELTEIMERMFDDGSTTPYWQDCVKAVEASDFYIIILGNRVGSFPPGQTRTYTEIEIDAAFSDKNKKVFFLKFANFIDSEIDNKAKHDEIIKKFDGRPSHTFKDITEFQNAFLLNLYQFFPSTNTEVDYNDIYFCDRVNQSSIFDEGYIEDNTIQFLMLSSHENDLPQSFVKRKKLEFDDMDYSSIEIEIDPTIAPGDSYETVEKALHGSIVGPWNGNEILKNYKLGLGKKFNVEDTLQILSKTNNKFLLISWQIKSIYWKNENLKDYLHAFFEKYSAMNKILPKTDQKIFFIGIANYTDIPEMTLIDFQQKVKGIKFGNMAPIELTKINKEDIKTWMKVQNIDHNPINQEAKIKFAYESEVIPEIKQKLMTSTEYYMAEIENSLKKILQLNPPKQ